MSVSSTGYNPSGCRSRQNRQDRITDTTSVPTFSFITLSRGSCQSSTDNRLLGRWSLEQAEQLKCLMGCLRRNEIASLGITDAVCCVGSRLRPVAIRNAHRGRPCNGLANRESHERPSCAGQRTLINARARQCRVSEVMLGLAHIIMKGVQHVSDR